MSLIDEVARLKAHCAQVPGYFATLEKLLAVLGGFQAGDARILAEVLSFIESEATESDWEDAIDVLHRYHGMAQAMEAAR